MLELLIKMRYTSKYQSETAIGILLLLGLILASPAFAQTAVEFTGTSWSEFSDEDGAKAVCADIDIDNDNDGLIELCYLEDVDAIRHQLDGSAYQSSASAPVLTTGCGGGTGNNECFGYELVRDLDFNENDSYSSTPNKVTWTTGAGWLAIAGDFSGILEGNGYRIANLFIDRDGFSSVNSRENNEKSVGFFRDIGDKGRIQNLGLWNVNVQANEGILSVLVSNDNDGTIINCYIQGEVRKSQDAADATAGLMVVDNRGEISNSYVSVETGSIISSIFVWNNYKEIANSYVSNLSGGRAEVMHTNSLPPASILNMYFVAADPSAVSRLNLGSMSNIYANKSSFTAAFLSVGGTVSNVIGFTTMKLQEPTGPGTTSTAPYYTWSEDDWDFGTTEEYPALRHARGDENNPACRKSQESTQQPLCGSLLRGQRNAQPEIKKPTNNTEIIVPKGEDYTISVTVSDTDINDELTVLLSAVGVNDAIDLVTTRVMVPPNTNSTRDPVEDLKIRVKTGTAIGAMMQLKLVATDDSGLENASSDEVLLTVVVEEATTVANTSPTIEIYDATVEVKAGREQTITATVSDANINDALTLLLTAAVPDQDIVKVVTTSVTVMTNGNITRDAQLTIEGLKAGEAILNLTVSDGDLTSDEISVRVTVEENTQPTITTTFPETSIKLLEGNSTASVVTLADDDDDDDVADLEISVESSDVEIATATITTRGTTRMLTIKSEGAGMATITATVDDGRRQTNSTDSLVFTVTVEANTPPTITITSLPSEAIEPNSTASIVVRVEDENYDVGDLVIVRAVSSTPSVARVTPKQIDEIKGNMNQRFVIHGGVAGESRIQFTATDSKLASTSASVLVHVNTLPSVVNVPTQVVATVGQAFTLDTSKFFEDADGDALSYSITTSSIVSKSLANRLVFSTTGTLTFTPIRTEASTSAAGQTVTVSVSDGRGGSATVEFKLLIDAEPAGGVSVDDDSDNRWLLRAESTVTDANGIASTTYQWYRGHRQITGEAATTYTIPDDPIGRAGDTTYWVEVTFVDNIGQSVTLRSNVYVIFNEKPVITGFDAPTMAVDEGSPMEDIRVIASDVNHNVLTYRWNVKIGDTRVLTSTNTNPAILDFPTDLVVGATTATTLILEVKVIDGEFNTTGTVSVVVKKKNNGQISVESLSRSERTLTLPLSNIDRSGETDGGVNGDVAYQWQQCLGGTDCSDLASWTDIGTESVLGDSEPSYTVLGSVNDNDRFRVKLTYTDGQGYDETVYSSSLGPDASADIKIRSKVFLEGPLQ